jgi:membrane protein implicated in regulation of membrane protease activity
MNAIPLETQLVVVIITFVVLYFLIKHVAKRSNSSSDNGNTEIDLNKMSKRDRKKKGSK